MAANYRQNRLNQIAEALNPASGGIFGEKFRGYEAERADLAREAQMEAIRQDYRSRLAAQSPDYGSIAKGMAQNLRYGGHSSEHGAPGLLTRSPGVSDAEVENMTRLLQMQSPTARRDQDALIESLAYNSAPNLRTRFHETMARNDMMGHLARGTVAAGAVGGTAAGLTAAGQGLMALMAYLQEGQQTAEERNNKLA
jgi:hypothetical protein